MLLKAQNLKKAYGIQELFDIEKLEIHEGDRIGLIGRNGAGKSTLLQILYGSKKADEGIIQRFVDIAMIDQEQDPLQADESADGAELSMISRMHLRTSACKSGGEKTRKKIAAAMSRGSKLLFADEPTTNLDLKGMEILETLFLEYKGALVLISHDRYFLDKICTSVWELEEGKLRNFPGGYAQWREQKKREREFAQFEYEQYQSEKRHLESSMRQVQSEAAKMRKPPGRMGSSEWQLYKGIASQQQGHVESRKKAMVKRIERLEVKEKPKELPPVVMRLGDGVPLTAKNAVKVRGLTVQYNGKKVLDHVDFELRTNKCTVMLGDNGAGKTTLIKSILNQVPDTEIFKGVKIGYFSQEHETLNENKTVLENVRASSLLSEHLIRCILANLYLKGKELEKKVSVLSPGERAKVLMARLMASDANVLILDEPANHIDMYTLEALETLLKQWKGTLLIVTHDRKLAQNIADRLVLVRQGKIETFEGDWKAYEQEQERVKHPKDSEQLNRTLLGMKMTELEERLKRPRKGDRVSEIQKELDRVTTEYYKAT